MDWISVFVTCMNILILQAKYEKDLTKIFELINRRNSMQYGPILGVPKYPEHLPRAEPILPGHSLIRPAQNMLKSAVKFPMRDTGSTLVYGNVDNIGITYANTNERVLYTDFRKANNLLATLANIIQAAKEKQNHPPMIIIKMGPNTHKKQKSKSSLLDSSAPEEDNDARETLDETDRDTKVTDDVSNDFDFRRRKKSKSKFRKRSYEESSFEGSSGSSEYEKNPGNPYTVYKNKYKQNWLWNHFMDGDHLNVNPYGPQTKHFGPPGQDLFFGRKWWYYNQDDYKPM